jgi:hypothetical protein
MYLAPQPLWSSPSFSALAMNSKPLSLGRNCGTPWIANSSCITASTDCPLKRVATSIRWHCRASSVEPRQRMRGEEGKSIYRQRAATSETVNADLKEHRGLVQLTVRGLAKARCVALWCALAYNLMHFGAALAG